MQASGNGAVSECVRNLILTVRGSVPYARMKGLDATLIDRPSSRAEALLVSDAEWLVRTYEPRAKLDRVDLTAALAVAGQFDLGITVPAERGDP